MASAAFADDAPKKKKWLPAGAGTAESSASPSAAFPIPFPNPPATLPLRYTVNYAVGCDPITQKGGTAITVINRRPYTVVPTVNWVTVKFYNDYGILVGQIEKYPMGSPDGTPVSGANSHMVTFGTSFEDSYILAPPSIGSSLFPWITTIPYDAVAGVPTIPCGYYGYAEIYSSHPYIQVAAFGVSGTGNVTELPMRRAKLPTVGGH